jgi:hypothetical protein
VDWGSIHAAFNAFSCDVRNAEKTANNATSVAVLHPSNIRRAECDEQKPHRSGRCCEKSLMASGVYDSDGWGHE